MHLVSEIYIIGAFPRPPLITGVYSLLSEFVTKSDDHFGALLLSLIRSVLYQFQMEFTFAALVPFGFGFD